MRIRIIVTALLLSAPWAPAARAASYPHAQELADRLASRNPDLLDVILHVSPAPGAANVVVAAHLRAANGEASGADDIGVATTGAPLVEVQKDGRRLGVLLQLRDARHRAIGAVGLMFAYAKGDDVEAKVRRAFRLRDTLAARIPSLRSLTSED